MEAAAKKAGLSWSDHVRTFYGLPITEGKPGVATGGEVEVSPEQTTIEEAEKAPVTKVEIEELAKKIYNSEGVTMRVARQRATQQLKGDK